LNIEKYCCKGISQTKLPEVIEINIYTENDIKELHSLYWKKNTEIKDKKIPRSEKKKESITWTKKVIAAAVEDLGGKVSYDPNQQDRVMTKYKILELVLSMYGKEDKGFDEMILRRTCNAVWNKLCVDKTRVLMTREIFSRVYPEEDNTFQNYYARSCLSLIISHALLPPPNFHALLPPPNLPPLMHPDDVFEYREGRDLMDLQPTCCDEADYL